MTALKDTIRNDRARIELLESTIEVQRKTIDLLKSEVSTAKTVADNNDQYLKRTNLRYPRH